VTAGVVVSLFLHDASKRIAGQDREAVAVNTLLLTRSMPSDEGVSG
jgi:hypothetical protein